LPPLARVEYADASGATWQQSGSLGGSVASAGAELRMALATQGWRLDKTIVLKNLPSRSELMLWIRRERRIIMMLWETGAGSCGFAWGEEK